MKRFINTKVVIDIESGRTLEKQGFEYSGPMALAVAATAITKLGEISSARGGVLEYWKFTLDAGSIAAAAQEVDTIAIPGARANDPCFISCEAPAANLLVAGAKVTADDVVSVYLDNNITVTTALDAASAVFYLEIFKRAIPPTIP